MALVKITQERSKIRCIEKHKRTIEALGLRRIRHSVIHEDTPQIRGMVQLVRYLVRVEPAGGEMKGVEGASARKKRAAGPAGARRKGTAGARAKKKRTTGASRARTTSRARVSSGINRKRAPRS